jgi:hypothetical protein
LKDKQETDKQQAGETEVNKAVAMLEQKVVALHTQVTELTAELQEAQTACDEAETECESLVGKLEADGKESARTASAAAAQLVQVQEGHDLLEQEQARMTKQLKMDHAMLVRSQKEEIESVRTESVAKGRLQDQELDGLRTKVRELTASLAQTSVGLGVAGAGAIAGGSNTRATTTDGRASSAASAPDVAAAPQVDSRQSQLVAPPPADLQSLLTNPAGASRTSNSGSGGGAVSSTELKVAQQQIANLTELLASPFLFSFLPSFRVCVAVC